MSKPSDFSLVLATRMAEISPPHVPGVEIVFANRVRDRLRDLGFECSSQQVAAWLKRIAKKELPPVVRDTEGCWAGAWGYCVTQWGRNELWNRGFTDLGRQEVPNHAER